MAVPMRSKTFSTRVVNWFHDHGRKNLPWQQNPTPYRVWVSEIMLQQTQVNTVIPYFERFMISFPDIQSLASAEIDQVLQHWSGLGYYARGRNLHKAAGILVKNYNGIFPKSVDELCALPGIGRSTAGAILSLGYGIPAAILDGNVKRTLSRFTATPGWPGLPAVSEQLWNYAENFTPKENIQAYTQAMMDLGATICTRTRPRCEICPLNDHCQARIQNRIHEFPGKKPARTLPIKHQYLIILLQDDKILLEQRPPVGIWGGLWSLPESDSLENIVSICETRFGFRIEPQEYLSEFRHTFSHYHLDLSPIVCLISKKQRRVASPAPQVWVNVENLQNYGLPAPIKTLLTRYLQDLVT